MQVRDERYPVCGSADPNNGSKGLIRQIRRHHDPIVASSLDGKNVPVSVDQERVHTIVNRQRAAAPKRGIQLAVGVEPCNATGIRPRDIGNKVADHDLSVRLHSQGLRGVMEPAEPEGRGTEAGIQHTVSPKSCTFVSVPPQSESSSQ